MAYQGLVWECRYSDIEVPDALWACTLFGAGKPYADDQASNMPLETGPMSSFDKWVQAFATHVENKGLVPGMKEAVRSAATTTNRNRAKAAG